MALVAPQCQPVRENISSLHNYYGNVGVRRFSAAEPLSDYFYIPYDVNTAYTFIIPQMFTPNEVNETRFGSEFIPTIPQCASRNIFSMPLTFWWRWRTKDTSRMQLASEILRRICDGFPAGEDIIPVVEGSNAEFFDQLRKRCPPIGGNDPIINAKCLREYAIQERGSLGLHKTTLRNMSILTTFPDEDSPTKKSFSMVCFDVTVDYVYLFLPEVFFFLQWHKVLGEYRHSQNGTSMFIMPISTYAYSEDGTALKCEKTFHGIGLSAALYAARVGWQTKDGKYLMGDSSSNLERRIFAMSMQERFQVYMVSIARRLLPTQRMLEIIQESRQNEGGENADNMFVECKLRVVKTSTVIDINFEVYLLGFTVVLCFVVTVVSVCVWISIPKVAWELISVTESVGNIGHDGDGEGDGFKSLGGKIRVEGRMATTNGVARLINKRVYRGGRTFCGMGRRSDEDEGLNTVVMVVCEEEQRSQEEQNRKYRWRKGSEGGHERSYKIIIKDC